MNALKRTFFILLILILLTGSFSALAQMPFNGDIVFHEIALNIPASYIRDSTQSHSDLWIFEQGFYSKYIILTRNNLAGDEAAALDDYAAYMQEIGAQVRRQDFLGQSAVHSVYTRNDQFCQEMMFAHEGSLYAIALRKSDAEEFQALLETVSLDPENYVSSGDEAPSTMIGRMLEHLFG